MGTVTPLRASTGPRANPPMNRLADTHSPYLLGHADNPLPSSPPLMGTAMTLHASTDPRARFPA